MKIFPVASRGTARAVNGVAIVLSGIVLVSCTPKTEEAPSAIALQQPTVYTEPLAKPTSRFPTPTPDPKAETPQPKNTKKPGVTVKNSKTPKPAGTSKTTSTNIQGMRVIDVRKGTGAEAVPGKTVVVDYRGTLLNGTQFDASYDRGEPFSFPLGGGQVIKGWDLGVAGMKVGGKRRLIIPPDLGYGAQGAGAAIPPNSTLIFEVELKAVQ